MVASVSTQTPGSLGGSLSGDRHLSHDKAAPIASVVVTTYRRPAMLLELLDALGPQIEGLPVEAIIIDNCSQASAREVVAASRAPAIRYVHETRAGVVHARNRGVAEARGTYVIFLDDDEVPSSGWLSAWISQADANTDASFGRIVPRPLAPCPEGLEGQIKRNFGRDMRTGTNADISDLWAHLGTGNAMFHKGRCFGQPEPFDARFNARGGEDVWLIRDLVRQGHRLIWNESAVVEELVPGERMTLSFLERRRFNQGQLRCILSLGNRGIAGYVRLAFWMLIGAVQALFYGTAAMVAKAIAPKQTQDFLCEASGGLGKLLWWYQPRVQAYGSS